MGRKEHNPGVPSGIASLESSSLSRMWSREPEREVTEYAAA